MAKEGFDEDIRFRDTVRPQNVYLIKPGMSKGEFIDQVENTEDLDIVLYETLKDAPKGSMVTVYGVSPEGYMDLTGHWYKGNKGRIVRSAGRHIKKIYSRKYKSDDSKGESYSRRGRISSPRGPYTGKLKFRHLSYEERHKKLK